SQSIGIKRNKKKQVEPIYSNRNVTSSIRIENGIYSNKNFIVLKNIFITFFILCKNT
ncbi:hypothetical protein GIB67_004027, partial [Kingdonia uniflora]